MTLITIFYLFENIIKYYYKVFKKFWKFYHILLISGSFLKYWIKFKYFYLLKKKIYKRNVNNKKKSYNNLFKNIFYIIKFQY